MLLGVMRFWVANNECIYEWEPTGVFSERTYIYRAASTFPSPFQAPTGCIVKSSCQEYEFAQILFCVMIVCEFFLLMMHTLKDLFGTCMLRLILLVCWALSVKIFHFCSEPHKKRQWSLNPLQGCFDECNVNVTNLYMIVPCCTGALPLWPQSHTRHVTLTQITYVQSPT